MRSFTATFMVIWALSGLLSFAYGFDHQPFMQAGVGVGYTRLNAMKNNSKYDAFNLGIHSQVGYRHQDFEYGLFSNIYVGNIEDIYIESEDKFISGDGWLNGTDVGLYGKYFLPLEPVSGWSPYLFLGPLLSLRTLRLSEFESNFTYSDDYKITFNSKGGQVRLGIEQKLREKKERPVYVELVYSFMKKYKGHVVDVSDYAREDTLGTKNLEELGYYTHSFMVCIGFVLL